MMKRRSIATIRPSTNTSVWDEFKIKNNRTKLTLLKIAKGEIENYIDVSNKVTKDEGYGEKFRA